MQTYAKDVVAAHLMGKTRDVSKRMNYGVVEENELDNLFSLNCRIVKNWS